MGQGEHVQPADIRNARLYLTGLAASLIGNSAMSLVAGIWVKSLTGSSAQAGLVSACIYAPSLAGPIAGLIADRVDRRRWLVAINLAAAAVMLTLLTVRSAGETWVLFVAMTAYGIEEVLSDPAESALFAQLLPQSLRLRINGWRLSIQEAGRLVAPLLGAGLFALVGGGAVASLDAVTFVIAAATTARLRLPTPTSSTTGPDSAPTTRPPGWWRELSAGIAHIRATPQLRHLFIAGAAVMAISGVGVAAQYSLVAALHKRPAFLGVLSGALGVSSIVASVSAARAIAAVGERRLALAGLTAFVVGESLQAVGTIPTAIAGRLVLGFALPWVFLAVLNLTQRLTPLELQGRVAAAVTFALFGPGAPMQALGSWLISQTGFREVYVGSASATAIVAAWLVRAGRTDDQPAGSVSPE